ncbi:helix-turn-helix domain-containing protein [Sphingomonas ursincola]|uniref:Helix-turn-helix domain-containing protein n=2 Tax=Sphingomonas ursincola TaxID=56361 RepID=A0A7V8RET4_9SPHN|nr:helix-turn-helix domain-containing protein [Sphingomonas ursincola]
MPKMTAIKSPSDSCRIDLFRVHRQSPGCIIMDRLYTIKQVCDIAGIGRSTVYRENLASRLPFVKVGRATRIRASDLKGWLDSLGA